MDIKERIKKIAIDFLKTYDLEYAVFRSKGRFWVYHRIVGIWSDLSFTKVSDDVRDFFLKPNPLNQLERREDGFWIHENPVGWTFFPIQFFSPHMIGYDNDHIIFDPSVKNKPRYMLNSLYYPSGGMASACAKSENFWKRSYETIWGISPNRFYEPEIRKISDETDAKVHVGVGGFGIELIVKINLTMKIIGPNVLDYRLIEMEDSGMGVIHVDHDEKLLPTEVIKCMASYCYSYIRSISIYSDSSVSFVGTNGLANSAASTPVFQYIRSLHEKVL